ncbi:site-2 protease family protein [Atopobiaceae bacterium 24-176]
MSYLFNALVTVAIVMWAATLHEVAHGYTAYLCGDTTAKDEGRLSLSPFKHLDPFGSVVLPLIMVLLGGPVFGYAKPVPYNPWRLRHRRRDEVLVALSGPASNIVQAAIGALVFRAVIGFWPMAVVQAPLLLEVLADYVWVNLVLCFFNLIPLPPLDGSHVIGFFLKGKALSAYYRVQRYAMPVLVIVLYLLPDFLHVNPLGAYFSATAGNLYALML